MPDLLHNVMLPDTETARGGGGGGGVVNASGWEWIGFSFLFLIQTSRHYPYTQSAPLTLG